MKRTTLWLSEPQAKLVEIVALEYGLKKSEIIRRAIDHFMTNIQAYEFLSKENDHESQRSSRMDRTKTD